MENYMEIAGDIFKSPEVVDSQCPILHCISADYVLGKGIALQIEQKYNVKASLKYYGTGKVPDCLMVNNVINMVTKLNYWDKPSYKVFEQGLILVRQLCLENNINKLVMPKIGAGLDRLYWGYCKEFIQNILCNSNISCVIYYLNK